MGRGKKETETAIGDVSDTVPDCFGVSLKQLRNLAEVRAASHAHSDSVLSGA